MERDNGSESFEGIFGETEEIIQSQIISRIGAKGRYKK